MKNPPFAIVAIFVTLIIACGCSAPQEIAKAQPLPPEMVYHPDPKETQATGSKQSDDTELVAVYRVCVPGVKPRIDLQKQWDTKLLLFTTTGKQPLEGPRGYSDGYDSAIRKFATDKDGTYWVEWELYPHFAVGHDLITICVHYDANGGYMDQLETQPKLAWDKGTSVSIQNDEITVLGQKLKL